MKFNKLRLVGFKSFVEATDFRIETGLTGVVGPNGCGKSNLVEALRWVMGESSYKNMRASGMDDVIFSGSGNRPARNTAEVTLFLDNGERRAPAGFNDADLLEVSRRIEREAGSVYRINGKDVRARDVQLLFADASTGARSPALVRQGQIGELIAAKPQARRQILEEASGISGLHSRRHEAEIRLKAAEQNLERVDDVLKQLDSQLDGLKRQAKQAGRFRALSAEIRQAEAMLFHLRWLAARAEAGEAEAALRAAGLRVAEATTAQAGAAKDQAVAAHRLPDLRDAEARAGAALQRLRLGLAEVDAEEKRLRDRMADLDRRIEQTRADLSREERLVADDGAAVARLDEEARALASDAASARETEEAARGEEAKAAATLATSEKQLQEATAEEAQIAARRQQLERTVRDASERLVRLEGQIGEVERERNVIEARLAAAPVVEGRRAAVEAAEAKLKAAEADAVAADERAARARQAETMARGPLSEAEKEAGRLETEARTLAKVLNAGGADLWPPVVDRIRVAPGYEAALGAALGEDLDVSTDEAAPVHWGEAGPADADPALPEGVEPLAAHVTAPGVLARRLAQIGIVARADGKRLARALRPGQRLVSKEGDLWRWDGFTAGAEAPTPAAQRLAQKNRLADLEALVAAAKTRVGERKAALDTAGQAARVAGDAERAAREAWRAAQHAADQARRELAVAERDLADVATKLSALAEARVRLDASLAEAGAVKDEAVEALADAPATDGLAQAIAGMRADVAQDRALFAEARARVQTLAREAEMRTRRLEAIERERASWRQRSEAAAAQVAVLGARLAETEAERTALAEQPDGFAVERRRLLFEIGKAEATAREAADARATGERESLEADRRARATLDDLATAREGQARAEARLEGLAEKRKEIARQIEETFEIGPDRLADLAGLAPGATPPDAGALEVRLDRLKQERERMGGVNLRADEEAGEVERARDTLVSERAELEEAIRRLRQGIGSLNREARERLTASFDVVNGHFKRLFTHLFGGGEAELMLVDSDDPLEAGLDILARPPGKKPQTMTLLSGGEQALTAMALIFAVFLTNPAPICVLDEVDAPLDDANVERYCDLLDEMTRSTDTRFLVITHNPITMARMNRLFGVTMAERGVSQLVSVDLETAERIREAS